jgi:hypothetical protein
MQVPPPDSGEFLKSLLKMGASSEPAARAV